MEQVTLGGDRLGSGNKQQVAMHGFERSNHDMSYIFRSTMSAGTLVPFMCEVGMPGDTIDIYLESECLTHPTIGPLFGSYKAQFDVFQIPIRLYNSWLHNNKLDIGRDMDAVKIPIFYQSTNQVAPNEYTGTEQINQSCILAYLGVRGIGNNGVTTSTTRSFNAIPLLAYWEIYKQYYANKQEEIGAVIHAQAPIANPINRTDVAFQAGGSTQLPEAPTTASILTTNTDVFIIDYTGNTGYDIRYLQIQINPNGFVPASQVLGTVIAQSATSITYTINGSYDFINWRWTSESTDREVQISTFALSEIDGQREDLLATAGNTFFNIDANGRLPYQYLQQNISTGSSPYCREFSQEGLAVKTYQSDIFNNWLNESWISDIATQSAVSTLGNSFTIDELTIKKKVWELLNRIAVSGGSYNDWITASYDQKVYNRAETPVYIGGMSKELIFQEVISNSASADQPLGTLAGRGKYSGKKKGGKIIAKCDEHCYILGIVSLTPRIDYSQGNKWDTTIRTMDEWHKPSLDQIGFQDLITEQMAWFDTYWNGTAWVQRSAGKQPAWINYQTNFNRTFGNFAYPDNEMFMTLNRRYEYDVNTQAIKDLTTYIDPAKFNFIFADTELDSQNFWMQIGVDIEARRKMSAKIMPNL